MENFDVKNQFRGFWISSSVSGIFLSNISLHDLSNLGVYSGSGIQISNITIRDVSCYRNVYGGIVLPSTKNLIIDNITAVLNNGGGISLTGADNFTLIDISSYGNSISTKNRPGLLLMDSTFGTIQGLTASGNSGGGLNLNNSSKIFISSSILKDQSGGVDFFIDSQSHDIALNNLRIGDLNGANLSASNISGSFSFNTSATHPDATGSFVSLNNYVNITHGSSGIFDLLSLNYSPSDIPFGYPENNIRILATNGTVWYPVSSTLHTDQHSVSFDDSDELWEGTWLYGLFTNKTIPSVLSVSPSSGSRESTNIEISITGSGFSEGSLGGCPMKRCRLDRLSIK
ncbi:right-handed parallel beta-helix repeat-containing protein [uncultured Methanospirillum sp.]|uniref:right-handed parallel beta-helix repeat-containing protein n=1 Tax=uncultured Methanospirillum sp. TaxID=262503 RepID=UPI0029C88050